MPTPTRVLIIEDSEMDARLIGSALRNEWPTLAFERVESAAAVREALKEQTWDCILCDMVIPGFGAPAALEIIKQSEFHPPFVVVSGIVDIEDAVSLMKAGAHDFVRKDDLARLVPAVKRAISDIENLRKKHAAESRLKDSEERFQAAAKAANDAIISADETGIITYWNAAASRIFGYPDSEIVGKPISTLVPESLRSMHNNAFRRANETGELRTGGTPIELTSLTKDGSELPIELSLSNWAADGKTFYTCVIRDITERKNIEQQLLQSVKMASIGELAAGVAHEINNPVGFVSSNLGALEDYVKELMSLLRVYTESESEEGISAESLKKIQQQKEDMDLDYIVNDIHELMDESADGLNRIKKIIQDLKDFSHADQGEWVLSDLHHGLDSTLNVVKNEIKYKAKVQKEYGDLPNIECLPSQLNQVFMNLLVNAAHAIERQGTITIRTGCASDMVWIEIEDTGKGIPENVINRIFDPFYTTKPIGKGTGLGLSLAYGIIEKHQGNLNVESEVGKGSVFRIELPKQHQAEAGATANAD